ncbi:uncharacterized protein DDB_G0271670-like [Punica granatum]|uniref:Suppressor protein SRP40-like n=2 Tax=Punica granatum TaxID=22663 RepID=A0A218VZS7_PUNGR|nr:uncharacterized protein DDB_G0271670-like [Punica granatum]OWM66087.1 hypothetical protein CDL15_Pgr015514 [Punica granatum]PKI76208.1 hypothetical protein CRG98_003319 [Punica granatum]
MGAEDDQREGLKFHGTMEEEDERSEVGSCLLGMEEEEERDQESCTSSGSVGSLYSMDSSDMEEDASSSSSSMLKYSSSSSSSSASLSNKGQGPLYELSELMSQLPMKRGLSKYYDGKAQSYTSLASVKSVEDLQKKEIIISSCSGRKRLKLCKSYGGGLDKSAISPKPMISKKGPQHRGLSSSSSSLGRRSSLSMASRPPASVLKT